MLGPADFALAGLVPGLVALAVRATVLRAPAGDRVAWPVAVAAGVVAGWWGLEAQGGAASIGEWFGRLPGVAKLALSPAVANHWLPSAVIVAAVVGVLAGRCRVAATLAALIGVTLAVAIPVRLLWGSVYLLSEWTRGEAIARLGALGVAIALGGWLLTRRSAGSPSEERGASGTVRAVLLAVTAFGLAIVLATSGSLSYARLAGVLVAAISGATLGGVGVAPLRRVGGGVEHAGPVIAASASVLLVLGAFFAEVTPTHAVLLAAAFVAAGTARVGRSHAEAPAAAQGGSDGAAAIEGPATAPAWRGVALRAVLCIVPLAVAATQSGVEFARAIAQPADNPYANWQPPE
ncbi:MAG: hypothetical protein AAF805_05120 [Planctomycetota bacterium]